MAYAELAGLPPITGLYTTVICLVGYAVFGPSRILVLGPDSSLGPMIAATILPMVGAGGDPERADRTCVDDGSDRRGDRCSPRGLAKLGFIADLLSKPTQIGYMNGLALTILVGQLPKLFGFSVDADGLIDEAEGVRRRAGRRRHGRRRGGDRPRQPGSDPGACSDGSRGSGGARRGRRRHRRCVGSSTSPTTACRWSERCRRGSPFTSGRRPGLRPAAPGRRSAGDRSRLVDGHDLHGLGLRRPQRRGGGRRTRR